MGSIIELGLELFMALSLAAASAAGEEASWRWRPERPHFHVAETQATATDQRGPFQFGEHRWLHAVKESAATSEHARRIFVTSTGVAYVPVASERRELLAMRHDLVIAGQVAFLQARANALALRPLLRRMPTIPELHAAHLLGVAGAARLVLGAATSPALPAHALLADAAREAPELLQLGGRPVSLGDLTRLFEEATARIAAKLEGGGPLRLPPEAKVPGRKAAVAWATEVRAAR